MKTCSQCKLPKHLDEFVKDKRRVDGHGSWCLACGKKYQKAWNASRPTPKAATDSTRIKTCTQCQTPKLLDEFVKDKRRSDGRGSWCLECNREYLNAYGKTPKGQASRQAYYEVNKETIKPQNRKRWSLKKDVYVIANKRWMSENRDSMLFYYRQKGEDFRAWLDELKEGCACLDCGRDDLPPYCMEHDHVRGKKRFTIGKMANHRREAVLEELRKCELVCCACHRIRTQSRNTHGEHTGPHQKWSSTRLADARAWIDSLKANPCMDCGEMLAPVAMDFDHVRGTKITEISDMWSWGRDKILAELKKCDLVCCHCHRKRTQQRRQRRAA